MAQSATNGEVAMRWLFTYDVHHAAAVYWELDDAGRVQRDVVMYGPYFDIATATTRPERLRFRNGSPVSERDLRSGETKEDRALSAPDIVYIEVSPAAFESVWHTARDVAA